MDPFSLLSGGAGGLSASNSATTGNADVRSATGSKTFNIGGNPNVAGIVNDPVKLAIVAAAVVLAFIAYRKWGR